MSAGLVAREIESRGIPTVVLNSIWSLQRICGQPRIAAIEFPMGRPLGAVGEDTLHREILLAALAVFETAQEPGWVEHLPFRWQHDDDRDWLPDPPPPYLLMIREGWPEMVKLTRKRAELKQVDSTQSQDR
ncbi:MAG: hypothetical protein ACI9QQ_000353 [Myxococcota bacterium]|jgi:hypothetical protein